MSDYTLWHGDCLEDMDRISDGSIDCILADLPYNATNCHWDTLIPFEPLWRQYKRVIKKNGAVVLFGRQPFVSMLIMSNLKWFKQELVWDKEQAIGNFALVQKRILPAHENILLFYDQLPTYNPQMVLKDRGKIRPAKTNGKPGVTISMASGRIKSSDKYDPELSYPVSVLPFSVSSGECNSNSRLHPAQKPVALLSYLIKTYTNEGDTILDNCAGSGSTLEAAMRNNRHSIGIEKDAHYFNVATQRLARVAADLRGELSHLPMFAEVA